MPELAEFVADARFCDDEPATALAILSRKVEDMEKATGKDKAEGVGESTTVGDAQMEDADGGAQMEDADGGEADGGGADSHDADGEEPAKRRRKHANGKGDANGSGDANGGDAEMEDADGGEADGGEADGGETDGDEADGGEANGDEADGGEASRVGQMTADAKRVREELRMRNNRAVALVCEERFHEAEVEFLELLKGHPTEIAPAYNLALLRWQLGFHDAAAQGWLRFRRWPLEATPDVYETRARNLRFVGPTDEYETVVTGHVDRASSTALDRAMLRHWANRQSAMTLQKHWLAALGGPGELENIMNHNPPFPGKSDD